MSPIIHAASFVERRTRPEFRRTFELLCWEGAFAMAYETWIGTSYLSGLAGEVGISIGLVTLLTSMPWIGSIGQIFGAWAYERVDSVKSYTVALAAAARALWSIPLFLAFYWAYRARARGVAFPKEDWFIVLAATGCLASLLATSSGAAWSSWMRGLVPQGFRGRFFGVRQRYVMFALVLANFLAAGWVGWAPGGYRVGYFVLGVMALVSAGISTFLLSRAPAPPVEPLGSRSVPRSIAQILSEPLRDRRFRNLLIFGASFHGMIQLAGPYFPYYFTKELGFPMSSVAMWTVLTNAGCLLAAGYWGRRIDRMGNPRSTLWFAAHTVALSPLIYVPASAIWVKWAAPFEYFVNGLAWSGYLLAMTSLQFSACPRAKNVAYFSVWSAAHGLTGALGSFIGGQLATAFAPVGGFRALWLFAFFARLATIWVLFRLVDPEHVLKRAKSEIVQPV